MRILPRSSVPWSGERRFSKRREKTQGCDGSWGTGLVPDRILFISIDCKLGEAGILDRISISGDEKQVCFEYQKGFQYQMSGRTLYGADFDADERTIRNARPFANEAGKPVWFAYPRWTNDQSAIVYHAGGKLYLYTLKDGSTNKVSTDDNSKYIYPHGEATPK